MADSIFVYPADTRPPRHFWRRAAAFVVDMVALYVVLLVLALPLQAVTGWSLGITLAQSTTCEVTTNSPLIRQVETEWTLAEGETRTNQICITTGLGTRHRIFISTVAKNENGIASNRFVSIGIDKDGNAIPLDISWTSTAPTILFQFFGMALFVFVTAKMTATGKRTPGKALLSLRVVDMTTAVPSLKRCLIREVWKFLPPCIFSFATTVHAATSLPRLTALASGEFGDVIHAARDMQAPDVGILFAVGFIAWIICLFWWFGPFFIWRGQSFYDRIAGCFVVRSEATAG